MKEKIKILIAESQNIVAIDLRATLLKIGHNVVAIATTGEEAIDKVKELKPDIVILDIYLDGEINGKTAAKQIKKFSKASIMLYSTYKDMSALTDELEIKQERILFNQNEENKLFQMKKK